MNVIVYNKNAMKHNASACTVDTTLIDEYGGKNMRRTVKKTVAPLKRTEKIVAVADEVKKKVENFFEEGNVELPVSELKEMISDAIREVAVQRGVEMTTVYDAVTRSIGISGEEFKENLVDTLCGNTRFREYLKTYYSRSDADDALINTLC